MVIKMKDIILFGLGGHAKAVVDSIETGGLYRIRGFLDKPGAEKKYYRNYYIIGNDNTAQELFGGGISEAFVSLGYLGVGAVRNELYENLKIIGYHLPVIIDNTASVALDSDLEEGTYIGKNAVINANVTIGKMCIINSGAVVEHDCVVSGFSHVAVNATVCGNCEIGHDSFIGAGSIILQGVKIGNHVIIGAGAIILKDVPDGKIIVGVYNG